MPRILLFTLLVVSFGASAIVIRHDIDDSEYRVQATEFLALADMPGEGHGVLIAPQWVITAAHAISWQSEIKQITVGGITRAVERIESIPATKPRHNSYYSKRWLPGIGRFSGLCLHRQMTLHC